jgi:hypothetical protein
VDDGERDVDVWLDPLTRGAHLHDLYAALARHARAAGRRVSRREHLEWFLALGRERLAELRRDMPPPSEEVYAVEAGEFLSDLAFFVDVLEGDDQAEPLAFEVSFGRPLEAGAEPLARREPVPLALARDRWLSLTGRVDRVDRLGAHAYRVVDYKTGRYWRDDWTGTFAAGTRLQHALYGVAVEALLAKADPRATVVGGAYVFPTGRGWGRVVDFPKPPAERLRGVLTALTNLIGGGVFTQAADKRECEWCDFAAACGREPWTRAARKQDANADGRLSSWRDLQEHA